jgi:hypothetical protein
MSCRSCSSNSQKEFGSEIIIHVSGLKSLDKPSVMVFPKVTVCLGCGLTEFFVPEERLRRLG